MEPTFNEQQQEETQLLPLIKLCYHQFLRHWWWFAVSVVVCLAAGWWYQQRQPRVFKRQSVMLIEDADVESGSMQMRGLKNSGLNFIGNVEAYDVLDGKADVVVTDGFAGNMMLKSAEATAKLMSGILKSGLKSSLPGMIAGALGKPVFDELPVPLPETEAQPLAPPSASAATEAAEICMKVRRDMYISDPSQNPRATCGACGLQIAYVQYTGKIREI